MWTQGRVQRVPSAAAGTGETAAEQSEKVDEKGGAPSASQGATIPREASERGTKYSDAYKDLMNDYRAGTLSVAQTKVARDIQATDLSRRIELGGPADELRDLGDTFDQMLDRLDQAFEDQRQFI